MAGSLTAGPLTITITTPDRVHEILTGYISIWAQKPPLQGPTTCGIGIDCCPATTGASQAQCLALAKSFGTAPDFWVRQTYDVIVRGPAVRLPATATRRSRKKTFFIVLSFLYERAGGMNPARDFDQRRPVRTVIGEAEVTGRCEHDQDNDWQCEVFGTGNERGMVCQTVPATASVRLEDVARCLAIKASYNF